MNYNSIVQINNNKYELEKIDSSNFNEYVNIYLDGVKNQEIKHSNQAPLDIHLQIGLLKKEIKTFLIKENNNFVGFIRFCFDGIIFKEIIQMLCHPQTKDFQKNEKLSIIDGLYQLLKSKTEIDLIYLKTSHRNKKIAYYLLSDFFKKNNTDDFFVRIDNNNNHSLALFKKLNFNICDNKYTKSYENWQNLKTLTQ